MMMMKEQRDIKPLLLKFGVALAISFARFLLSRLRTKRIKPSSPPHSPRSLGSHFFFPLYQIVLLCILLDHGSEVNLKGGRVWHKNDLHAIKTTSRAWHKVNLINFLCL